MTPEEFARAVGAQMPPEEPKGRTAKRGRRADGWAAMHTLAVLMTASGLLFEQYRLMGIGLCWALWMLLAGVRKAGKGGGEE